MMFKHSKITLKFFSGAVGTAAALLICGCVSNDGFHDGRNDIANYDALPLSMSLSPPGGVKVKSDGLRCVELEWPVPAEDIFRYRIERAEALEGPFAFVANVDPRQRGFVDGSHAESRLKDSTTYYYRLVTIEKADGARSMPGDVLSAVTAPPPVPVQNVKVRASGSRANTLSWSASESGNELTYRIERAAADAPENFAAVGSTRETLFVDGGTSSSTLLDSSKYLYRIVTLNAVEAESEPSEIVEVVTLPPPQPVAGFEGLSGEVRCAPLKWSASPETDVIAYHIFCARSEEEQFDRIAEVKGRENTTFLHGNANPGELEDEATYYYKISALNNVGAVSQQSESIKVVTRQIPPVVNGVAVESLHPREVPISWEQSPDVAVSGYEIWRSLEGGDDWQQIKILNDSKTVKYLDRGGVDDNGKLGALLDGTNYVYRVIAFNTGGVRSSASAPVTATTKFVPEVPSNLQASSGLAGVIKLSWNSNPEKDIKGYQVDVSSRDNRGFKQLCFVRSEPDGVTPGAEERDLKVDVTRYYRVKALDVEGLESRWSEVVSGVTKALPAPPSELLLSDNGDTMVLRWLDSPQRDIVRYNLWSRRLIGWQLLGECDKCEYIFDKAALKDVGAIAVSAIDADGLESEKSTAVKCDVLEK